MKTFTLAGEEVQAAMVAMAQMNITGDIGHGWFVTTRDHAGTAAKYVTLTAVRDHSIIAASVTDHRHKFRGRLEAFDAINLDLKTADPDGAIVAFAKAWIDLHRANRTLYLAYMLPERIEEFETVEA
jgi:hypothetical protein